MVKMSQSPLFAPTHRLAIYQFLFAGISSVNFVGLKFRSGCSMVCVCWSTSVFITVRLGSLLRRFICHLTFTHDVVFVPALRPLFLWPPCLAEADWDWYWVWFNVPLNGLQVISGAVFYGSYHPTNGVKALKEVVVLRTGFNPTRSTSPCYKPTHAYNIQSYTRQNESKHSEMGPV